MSQIKAGQIFYPQQLPQVPQKKKEQHHGPAFDTVLQKQLANIRSEIGFSHHAIKRLEERGISLGNQEMARLTGAIEKAQAKGAKESLVLMDNVAFIVSVTNRKVITAVDGSSMKDNVFTNIDSAIIV
ncbi:hypothetical protein JQN58_02355 [Aneurinibacillus sp. BA2021]|nr:hypothetical protein [Aneurinibacillus sp. BA2021]